MKKIVSCMLICLLLVSCFSGCSNIKEVRELNNIVKDFGEKIDPIYELSVEKDRSIKLTQVIDEDFTLSEMYEIFPEEPDYSEREFLADIYMAVYIAKKMARDLHTELKNVYGKDIRTKVELIAGNKIVCTVDNDGNMIVDNIDKAISFDYDYYKGIEGKWYECDNYWVDEDFYERNEEPYWFYDSCSPGEYEGEGDTPEEEVTYRVDVDVLQISLDDENKKFVMEGCILNHSGYYVDSMTVEFCLYSNDNEVYNTEIIVEDLDVNGIQTFKAEFQSDIYDKVYYGDYFEVYNVKIRY